MSDTYSHISPFALSDGTDGPPFANEFGNAAIKALDVPALVSLSGKLDDKSLVDLPKTNHITHHNESRSIFALAPDHWLICDTNETPEALLAEVCIQFTEEPIACADQFHAWSILRLSGTCSAKTLSRLCPVDLHSSVFGKDMLFQTNMGGIHVMCTRTANIDTSFDLYIPHSYSRSFYELLRDAIAIG